MRASGKNETIHVFEEFTCQAILPAESLSAGRKARGVNPGMHVVIDVEAQLSTTQPAGSELRQLSNSELAQCLKQCHLEDGDPKLRELFDVVAERLQQTAE